MKKILSDKFLSLPPYVFSEISRIKTEAQKRGIDLLSLAIGDPDLPTPKGILEKIHEASQDPYNHTYSPYEGSLEFRKACANWMQKRFNVSVNPEKEVLALIGSKEGLAHFPWAILNPGDSALFPSPGYPIFEHSIVLAGGRAIGYSLKFENAFLPEIQELSSLIHEHNPKYMILNFPSNPTSAGVSLAWLEEVVQLARNTGTFILYDNAYSEMYFNEAHKPPSILQAKGAKEVAIELHSFSKSFNMTGWRLGFAVGAPELVSALLAIKTNIDSGPLLTVQKAGCWALANAQTLCEPIRETYASRRKVLLAGLQALGIEYFDSDVTFFLWAKVPTREKSMDFCRNLIEKQGLVVTPGIGFGAAGEGFFRLSMTVSEKQIEQAIHKLGQYLR